MGTVYTPNSNQGKNRCELCGKIFETPEMVNYHKILEHGAGKIQPTGVS